MTTGKRRKLKLIRDDVKERHTSHWDLDYLSREELERLMTGKPEAADVRPAETGVTQATGAGADDPDATG
jgi:hypothetical protein